MVSPLTWAPFPFQMAFSCLIKISKYLRTGWSSKYWALGSATKPLFCTRLTFSCISLYLYHQICIPSLCLYYIYLCHIYASIQNRCRSKEISIAYTVSYHIHDLKKTYGLFTAWLCKTSGLGPQRHHCRSRKQCHRTCLKWMKLLALFDDLNPGSPADN